VFDVEPNIIGVEGVTIDEVALGCYYYEYRRSQSISLGGL